MLRFLRISGTSGSSPSYDCSPFPPPCTHLAEGSSGRGLRDRKSTRLNSSHDQISYAVFCLKKKKNIYTHASSRESGEWLSTIRHPCGRSGCTSELRYDRV